MRFSLSVAVAAMILFVCLNACGGWVCFKDGDGYWAFCNAVGNQELEIREKRLDGGYVEYSTLAVIAGHENIVRDSVLTFVDGFRRLICSSNEFFCATADMTCRLLTRPECEYDFGAGHRKRIMSNRGAEEFKSRFRHIVESCRKTLETSPYDAGLVYYRKRYKPGARILHVKYEDVVGTAHLYSGLCVCLPAKVSMSADGPKLMRTDVNVPEEAFLQVYGEWLDLDENKENACNAITCSAGFIQGRVEVLPGGFGNATLKDWRIRNGLRPKDCEVIDQDGDDSLSMEYYSPCPEFRFILRDEKCSWHLTYCGGVLSLIKQEENMPSLSVGGPFDALDQACFDLSGRFADSRQLSIKDKLKGSASALGLRHTSLLCKAKRWSALKPIEKDAKLDLEVSTVVKDLMILLSRDGGGMDECVLHQVGK